MGSSNSRVVEGFSLAAFTLCVAAGAAFAPQAAHAERGQYKWTDSVGRVHYSDRPPPVDHQRVAVAPAIVPAANAAASVGDSSLPWALRSAAARYPVVLYTSLECDPCEIARSHLAARGVPYTEKRVENAADLKAFQALGFSSSLFPSASIGREKLTGFEAGDWNRVLDASGYPKASMLPATHLARTLEPMRADALAAEARALEARVEAARAAAVSAQAKGAADSTSLLTPSSFKTGPNPIRF